jgi:hypothetical protein
MPKRQKLDDQTAACYDELNATIQNAPVGNPCIESERQTFELETRLHPHVGIGHKQNIAVAAAHRLDLFR